MNYTNDGGPVFPVPESDQEGMLLREYFAAKAMQGLVAHWDLYDVRGLAKKCYEIADALLQEY